METILTAVLDDLAYLAGVANFLADNINRKSPAQYNSACKKYLKNVMNTLIHMRKTAMKWFSQIHTFGKTHKTVSDKKTFVITFNLLDKLSELM